MPFPLLPVLGALGAGAIDMAGALQQQHASAREARRNREFQERMRATQYQTAVQDMRTAGLNPALAYMQGGAGTPSGSVGAQEGVGDVGSRAMSSARDVAEMKLLARQSDLLNQQALKIQAERQGVDMQNEKLREWLGIKPDGTVDPNSAFAAEIRRARAGAETTELSNEELRAIADLYKEFGGTAKGIERFLPLLLRILGR